MKYLDASEFEVYGLEATTPESAVAAASALMDAHCRRESLGVTEYTERMRLNGSGMVRLSYLPLATVSPAVTPLQSVKVHYGVPRHGELNSITSDGGKFGITNEWTAIGAEMLDCNPKTGEVTLPMHPFGFGYNEVEIKYTAGLDVMPGALKCACAQIVRNCQATPALNVKANSVDSLHLEYFS